MEREREGGRKRERRCCFMIIACVLVLGEERVREAERKEGEREGMLPHV